MNFKRVLLVNPPYSGNRVRVVFSAGLGYIAEYLTQAGVAITVLDMSLGYSYRDLRKKVLSDAPDLIAFSIMTYHYQETYRLVRKIKKDFPNIPIAAGGPHISLFREEVLQACDGLDYGIVLEGEETMAELCQGKPPAGIKGLIFRAQGRVIYNGDRPFIKDLDQVPFPRYAAFELERSLNREVNALPLISSRGCPFDCIYCPVKCSIGENFRTRSPESIMTELSYWYERGWRRFSFGDDNFTLIRERVQRFCELVKASNLTGLKLSCDNGIRADRVDRDLLCLMKEAGFYRIALGVEAGNDKVLKMLKKRESIVTIKARIQEAAELGYEVDLFFLVGSPGETMADLEDSFKIAMESPVNCVYFYNIIPFPHTELFDWIGQNGKLLADPAEYLNTYPVYEAQPLFETKEMPYQQRKKALRRAFRIMSLTTQRSWSRRLAKLGWLGKILAYLYTRNFVQNIVLRHKFFNNLLYRIAKKAVAAS